MIVKIVQEKTFELIKTSKHSPQIDMAKYLCKGDVFLPDGKGWEYRVIKKVMCIEDGEYCLKVMVKKL